MTIRFEAAVVAAMWVTAVAASPPMVESAREGVDRRIDPANYAGCLWGVEPHEHGEPAARGGIPGVSTTLISNGPSSNRIDLVVVGDGYTAGELGNFAAHAQSGIDDLFAIAPFNLYKGLFNVHRVDVISNESGVDNDPSQGIERDTALGMAYWCNGIERLLCVNTGAASSAANNAPDWDQIFAVANSTKYGGAGYSSSNIGTYAGGNSSAAQVAIHELGHSLGNLADEYTYGGPAEYSGGEPSARNVSVLSAAEQAAQGLKWSSWLGVDAASFDGLVDTFEGGQYSVTGIYRPSGNSMMRSLGREFNLPSVESLIIEMWKVVSPIDAYSSNTSSVSRTGTLVVESALPSLSVQWFLNGSFVHSGSVLDVAAVNPPSGESTLHVVVSDRTPLVRDDAARELYMTQRVIWTIEATAADVSGDGVVDGVDLAILLAAWGSAGTDLDGDGVTNSSDLAVLLASWD